jgi:protein-S-isoprenylcysteine O-methyltransferase Ste14
MYYFLIPLIFGFISNLASSFTATYSVWWGKRNGTIVTVILRDILGIPVWVIGYMLAIRERSELLYQSSTISQLTGWIVIICGIMIITVALFTIRTKAAAPATGDSLIKSGIYSKVRHPIHSGTFLEFMGLFILWPSLLVGIASVLGIVWLWLQTIFEELDLIKRIPEYRDYMKKVSRFLPVRRKI